MTRIIQFFAAILLPLLLSSCAAQRHTENALNTYQTAISQYKKKDYYDARKLFQETIPLLRGKKEIILAQFYLAQCYFYDKKYKESAYYFAEFFKTYPRVQEAEEALYMQGYSMYLSSPDTRRNATTTEKALRALQQYKHRYPTGIYQVQVQQYIQELQGKLALKAFRNAKLYYDLGHYQAAVIEMNNFQEAYPESLDCQESIYIKAKAQYKLAEASKANDQLSSWKMVIEYYNELLDQYPDSKYAQEMQAIYEQALKQLDKFLGY